MVKVFPEPVTPSSTDDAPWRARRSPAAGRPAARIPTKRGSAARLPIFPAAAGRWGRPCRPVRMLGSPSSTCLTRRPSRSGMRVAVGRRRRSAAAAALGKPLRPASGGSAGSAMLVGTRLCNCTARKKLGAAIGAIWASLMGKGPQPMTVSRQASWGGSLFPILTVLSRRTSRPPANPRSPAANLPGPIGPRKPPNPPGPTGPPCGSPGWVPPGPLGPPPVGPPPWSPDPGPGEPEPRPAGTVLASGRASGARSRASAGQSKPPWRLGNSIRRQRAVRPLAIDDHVVAARPQVANALDP